MKKYFLPAVLPALIILVWSCEPALKVSADYDRSVDFSSYKTFALYQGDTNRAVSPLNVQRILTALRSEMRKRGFQETSSFPDVLVNPVAIMKDKVVVSSVTNYYGYGGLYRPYYWGGGGGFGRATNYDVEHVKNGSLIIDVVDAKTNKLIWQGIGNKEIDANVKDPDTRIARAVSSIMSEFPPMAYKKNR